MVLACDRFPQSRGFPLFFYIRHAFPPLIPPFSVSHSKRKHLRGNLENHKNWSLTTSFSLTRSDTWKLCSCGWMKFAFWLDAHSECFCAKARPFFSYSSTSEARLTLISSIWTRRGFQSSEEVQKTDTYRKISFSSEHRYEHDHGLYHHLL